jgi:hypothetical protein
MIFSMGNQYRVHVNYTETHDHFRLHSKTEISVMDSTKVTSSPFIFLPLALNFRNERFAPAQKFGGKKWKRFHWHQNS